MEISDDEDEALYQYKHPSIKRRKLNDSHILDNHDKILELMLNQQKIIEEFKKTIHKLNKRIDESNKKVKESNNKIYELEETVRKQQLSMREYMPPTIFKSPASYYY